MSSLNSAKLKRGMSGDKDVPFCFKLIKAASAAAAAARDVMAGNMAMEKPMSSSSFAGKMGVSPPSAILIIMGVSMRAQASRISSSVCSASKKTTSAPASP